MAQNGARTRRKKGKPFSMAHSAQPGIGKRGTEMVSSSRFGGHLARGTLLGGRARSKDSKGKGMCGQFAH
ncbi:NACHT and WD repeat domain-containing protein 1-like protein [Anopheles sinensis]|uniref:NACHT and WD repeat domain-containing protein 1-like protein n=1 Tax=Anopheles sinensis TaxID=74873 RepID=A0A084W6Y2_ANOSI|nr:NACHT and WD repeat domain-containing protein 1-like protein [Anopheles sinensis]